MHDEQTRKDLKENVKVLDRTALLADWFRGDATENGTAEDVARTKHDAEVLRGYSHINQLQLDAINDEHARGDKPDA